MATATRARTKAIHLVEFLRFAESMTFILLIVTIIMLTIFVIMMINLTIAIEFVAPRP